MSILALDISTACIGYSVFASDKSLLDYGFIDIKNTKDIWCKLDVAMAVLNRLKSAHDITEVVIEDALNECQETMTKLNEGQ